MSNHCGSKACLGKLPTVILGILVMTLASSCSKAKKMEIEGKLDVYPVEGKLTVDGEPAQDAAIVFHPITKFPKGSAQLIPRATVDEEGNFRLTTYEPLDGAPAGKYRITISWRGKLDGVPGESEDQLPNRLLPKYQSVRTTDLKYEVKEGKNVIEPWEFRSVNQQVANRP